VSQRYRPPNTEHINAVYGALVAQMIMARTSNGVRRIADDELREIVEKAFALAVRCDEVAP
jgi:hypothetical protein